MTTRAKQNLAWICIFLAWGLAALAGCGGVGSVPDEPAPSPPGVVDRPAPPEPAPAGEAEPRTVMDLMLRYMPGTPEALAEDLHLARTRPETVSCPDVENAPVMALPWERTPTGRLAEQLPMVMVCAAAGFVRYGDLEARVKAELERRLTEGSN